MLQFHKINTHYETSIYLTHNSQNQSRKLLQNKVAQNHYTYQLNLLIRNMQNKTSKLKLKQNKHNVILIHTKLTLINTVQYKLQRQKNGPFR
jgi:hypothetical protein